MSRMIPAVASVAELKVHQKWSRRHAGGPAGRAIAAITISSSSNYGGLAVEEKRRKQQDSENCEKMGFCIIPRIIPDSCFKLPGSEPWYICKIRTCVL